MFIYFKYVYIIGFSPLIKCVWTTSHERVCDYDVGC
uniref:Uncharacterized protein n=1 Tax=Anguilla anguilla TaxID=7936 RepID=A0A0E9SIC4_ANGAN